MKNLLLLALFCGVAGRGADTTAPWQKILMERLPAFGHRNWIVVADSAYPAQARDGIETIVADADQLQVLQYVLAAVARSKHVTPVVHTDTELQYLENGDAPGVEEYRTRLAEIFKDKTVEASPHEALLQRLDEVSHDFRVLIIKTNMTIPYTSVFLQLDCSYWPPDSEKGLRDRMAQAGVR